MPYTYEPSNLSPVTFSCGAIVKINDKSVGKTFSKKILAPKWASNIKNNAGLLDAYAAEGASITLLRLSVQDVLEISRKFPETGEYLSELNRTSEAGLDHRH